MEALFFHLETKAFEDITVTDLTKTAGVARLTFYRHFEDKAQVLLSYLDAEFDRYMKDLPSPLTTDLHLALSRCFECWQRYSKLPVLLAQQSIIPLILASFGEHLFLILNADMLPRRFSYFQRKFIEGGLIVVMMEWIADPQGHTPQEMARLISDLISPPRPKHKKKPLISCKLLYKGIYGNRVN